MLVLKITVILASEQGTENGFTLSLETLGKILQLKLMNNAVVDE